MKFAQELKTRLLADKKVLLLIGCFIAGLLLLALSGTGKTDAKKESADAIDRCTRIEEQLESRVYKLLNGLPGVGKTRVMVTVDRLAQYTYAQEEKQLGADGRTELKPVIVENGNAETGLQECIYAPMVRGVAVCCEGGGSVRIQKEITGLLSAAFGVGANRIYVTELKK